jgi:hypothetical protein
MKSSEEQVLIRRYSERFGHSPPMSATVQIEVVEPIKKAAATCPQIDGKGSQWI